MFVESDSYFESGGRKRLVPPDDLTVAAGATICLLRAGTEFGAGTVKCVSMMLHG